MSQVRDAIHDHHQQILARLGDHVAALIDEEHEGDPAGLVEFLKSELMPHAAGEERHMYPAVDPLIREHGRPTATMSVDHEFIAGYVHDIEDTAAGLREASAAERPALLLRLQRLILQLDAVLRLHLEKEERVYLPLFEEYLSDDEQRQVLEGMHEAGYG
jgi:hemerythrin-like domain-containing protein